MATVVGKNSKGGIAKVGKNSSSKSTSSPSKSVDYTFRVGKESASQYNARVANERGDSAKELKSMQDITAKTYKAKGLNPDALTAIPANAQAQTPAVIPPPPTVPNLGINLQANNATLGAGLSDFGKTYDTTKGQFVDNPVDQQPQGDAFSSLFQQAQALQGQAFNEMGSAEERLAKLERQNQIKQKQQAVNDYTSQLNAITTDATANKLALEGQGRGQTAGFIGGEQARIDREAAIRALPVQAQLAAAQGNLQMAQEHVDKLFQVQSQDAQAKYQYKSNLISAVYNFATGQEQRRLDAIKQKEDRAYDMQKTNLSLQNDWAKTAIEYGQSSLAGSIMKLDPKSATFQTDLSALQGRVTKPVSTTQKAPTLQNFGTSDAPNWKQYDYTTGQWADVGGISAPQNSPEKAINQLDFMLGTINKANNFANASGNTGILGRAGRFLGGADDYTNLVAETNTLRTNMLTLATDPTIKKFFGPNMSNADVQLMTSAGTTLNPELQSPTQMKDEISRIKDFTERAKMSVQGVTQFGKTDSGVRIGVFPDGTIRDVTGKIYNESGDSVDEQTPQSTGFFDSFLKVFGL